MPVHISAAGAVSSVFEKLAEMTSAQRVQYISMVRPFLTSDTGVSAGIDNVNSGLFEKMLGTTFTPVQKDMFIRVFKSLACIKEDTGIRLKYADIFQNKIPADISVVTEAGIEKMLEILYEQSPEAKKVMNEDGYTPAVIANALKIIPEINKGPLMEYTEGTFMVGNIDAEFSKGFDAVWNGYTNAEGETVTAYKLAEGMVNFLNWVPDEGRLFAARALESLGVCSIKGAGTKSPAASVSETEHYTVIKSMSGVPASVFNGAVVVRTKQDIPKVIEVLLSSDNPMMYKLVGASILREVKYSVPTDKGIKAIVEPDTVYVIKTAAYPFVDANGWGKQYIAALNARGIINGKSEAEFMPEAPITREEFIKLVVELFNLLDESAECKFSDVAHGAWYEKYVASAHKAGITDGIGNGRFGTGQHIKRQDMAKIINTILKSQGVELSGGNIEAFRDDAQIADYAKEHVYAISGHIISGDDAKNFNPNKNATRQEAAKMVYGMLMCYILHN